MALLHGAAQSARATGWRLSVGHVHHGWRGREADRDLAFVREHARRLGLPFFFRRRDARKEARALGLSPEAGARHARYAALQEMAVEAGAERIATAHQRDDRLETYLLARERRAGLAGLAGVKRERADGVVRPMLDVSRREILGFLRARGIGHRRDASNGDLRLSRNRVRREIVAAPRGGRGGLAPRNDARGRATVARTGRSRAAVRAGDRAPDLPRARRGPRRRLLPGGLRPAPPAPGRRGSRPPLRPAGPAAADGARARADRGPPPRKVGFPIRGRPPDPVREARADPLRPRPAAGESRRALAGQ